MARVKRQNQRRQRKHIWNFKLNLHVPTVSWVLICFSVAFFYVANGNWLLLLAGWLLITSAAVYFNTYWFGDAKQLQQRFDDYHVNDDLQILILDASKSDSVKKQIDQLGSLSNVTLTKNNFDNLKFNNGEFDVVLVHYIFQDIQPRLTRIKAMQESARVVKANGKICFIEKGFNLEHYGKFLRQSGFNHVQIKNNGFLGWWSGPWRPSFTITGQKW